MNLSTVAIFISILTLGFTIYTYYKHDKEIKVQTSIINEFQIEKYQKEIESDKKALIDISIVKKDKGKRILKVLNSGLSIAHNLKVIFPREIEMFITPFSSPTEIKPGGSFDIYFQIYKGSPDLANIEIEWDDDFEKNRKEKLKIQL